MTPDASRAVPAALPWRPVWREGIDHDDDKGSLYTIRLSKGSRHVIKRPTYSVKRCGLPGVVVRKMGINCSTGKECAPYGHPAHEP